MFALYSAAHPPPVRVLVFEASSQRRIRLRALLGDTRYEVIWTVTPGEALAEGPGCDLALLSLEDQDAALTLCRNLTFGPKGIPVLGLARQTIGAEARLAAIAAGAEEVIEGPAVATDLFARIRRLLAQRIEQRELHDRLCVCRNPETSDLPQRSAVPWTLAVIGPPQGAGIVAPETALPTPPIPHLRARILHVARDMALRGRLPAVDAVLIRHTPDHATEDLHLLADLRSQRALHRAAICLGLPASAGAGSAAALAITATALDLGAVEVLPPEACAEEIGLRLGRQITRKRQADRMRAAIDEQLRQSVTDPLTGLYNRRHALPELARIAERARLRGAGFGLLLADIDRFKRVNDRYGHAAGDQALSEIADRLTGALGPGDLLARIGGEEFLAVLPGRSEDDMRRVAEAMRAAVAATPIRLDGGDAVPLTLSVGMAWSVTDAGMPADAVTTALAPDALMALADAALMHAKATGRDRVSGPADLRAGIAAPPQDRPGARVQTRPIATDPRGDTARLRPAPARPVAPQGVPDAGLAAVFAPSAFGPDAAPRPGRPPSEDRPRVASVILPRQ